MASNTLKKITTRAKQIRKSHPSMSWKMAIKKSGAEYRSGSLGYASYTRKKIKTISKAAKLRELKGMSHERAVKSVKISGTKSSKIKRIKRLHASEGKAIRSLGSISFHKSQIKKAIHLKLSSQMLRHHLAKKKTEKRKVGKKIMEIKRELKRLSF